MAAFIVQNYYKSILLTTQFYLYTGKHSNHMKNRFLSVDLHKGLLLLALVLSLQITGNAKAYVIKEDVDSTTNDIIKSEFTTEIIFDTTVTENPTAKTVIASESCNHDICNPTPQLNTAITEVKTENITEQVLKDSHDTTILTSTTNVSNIETFDEINEIQPSSSQLQDGIEKVGIFSSELFPHSKPFENQTNTENLEETIRNSVKNEIEVEQNSSSSALLDVLQEIPELQIRQSLADEILLNKDPYGEEEKENQVQTLRISTKISNLEQQGIIETNNAEKKVADIFDVETPTTLELQSSKGIEKAEYFEKNCCKVDNITDTAKMTENNTFPALNLHQNDWLSHKSSVKESSLLMEHNREEKKLKQPIAPQNNEINLIDNSNQFQTNKHLLPSNILQTQAVSASGELQDVENSILSNASQWKNSIEMVQQNELKFQDQATSQPFSVEIKETILSTDDFTNISPIIEADTNDLAQEIFAIDNVTEAAEYIENDLVNAAVSGDNPHFIIKKQGVEDVQEIEIEKNDKDYVDITTEFLLKVTEDNTFSFTEKLLESSSTEVLNNVELNTLHNSGEADLVGEEIKNTTDELAVIPPPSDSMPSNNAGSVDELSGALISHSIKGAIYPYSLYSTRHSTLILCSISALLLLFLLLTVFLKLERHHGTLNIEMQEQRCGKDQLDEEFEKCLKLLDVELSIPAPIETDESEECLQTSST